MVASRVATVRTVPRTILGDPGGAGHAAIPLNGVG